MTQETPERVPTDPLFCDDCAEDLVVEKDDRGRLQIVCGCGTERKVKVKQALPGAWF